MSEPPRLPPLQVGTTVGPFRIDSVLGVGGMGLVYRATDLRLDRQVAFKVLLGHYAAAPEFRHRFQHEAAVLARLDSPHVITIIDHGEYDGQPWIATQYAAGGDLGKQIRARGALPTALALRVCAQVADALAAAHSVGVVHRDVKPANVLLRDERLDRLHVYLCDFGVAHTTVAHTPVGETPDLTSPGAVAGTWNYLAPERARGEAGGPASDVYSVGCLLWEALTGRPPYSGTDIEVALAHARSAVPQLPGDDPITVEVNRVLARATAKDPDERHASATELRDDLRALGRQLTDPFAATALGGSRPGGGRRSRGVLLGALGGGAAVIGGVVVAVLLMPSGSGDDPGPEPTGPTESAPPEPAADPVTGDLDGDGDGDFATLTDAQGAYVFANDDGAFSQQPEPMPELTAPTVSGDIDGDGRTDFVTFQGLDPAATVFQVFTAKGPVRRRVTTVPALGLPLGFSPDQTLLTGDVDGDGFDDVVLVSQNEDQLVMSVLRGRRDGTLGRPKEWFRSETDAAGDTLHRFVAGDFDDDGRDDVVYEVEIQGQPAALQLLPSTGEEFGAAYERQPLDEETYFGWFRTGDFDGDGADDLGFLGPGAEGVDAFVWSWTGEAFEGGRALPPSGDFVSVNEASVADLDGDGDDDWVWVTVGPSLRTLLAEDGELAMPDTPTIAIPEDALGAGTIDQGEFPPI